MGLSFEPSREVGWPTTVVQKRHKEYDQEMKGKG